MIGGEDHATCGDLGLIDRRHRLRMIGQAGEHPGELRGVDRRHLDDRDVMSLWSCSNSVRTDSVKPLTACFAPQYADCRGMLRDPSADPTCTMVPESRGRIRASATIVP